MVRRILAEIWNVSLLRASWAPYSRTDWYSTALTAYHLGFIGLLLWTVYMLLAMGVVYLFSADGVFVIASRILSVVPLAPVAIFLFVLGSNYAVEGMQDIHKSEEPVEPAFLPILIVSIFALTTAIVYRAILYTSLHDLYGPTISGTTILSVMIVDGLHISLILMGVGGITSLFFAPSDE